MNIYTMVKDIMEKQVNTEQDYHKLHQIVLDYQKDKSNANNIIECFDKFLWMFINVIHSNNIQMKLNLIKVKSVKKFISMFIHNKENKKNINRAEHRAKANSDICDALNNIHDIFSQFTEDDIRNELISALLLMATKYKDKRPSFHNYVDKCFYYYAYIELSRLIKDPLGKNNYSEYIEEYQELNDDTNQNKDYNKAVDIYNKNMEDIISNVDIQYELKNNCNQLTLKENPSYYSDSFFNINWINGITCSDLFTGLGEIYREILIMYYIDKLTDAQIAKKLGVCRIYVNKRRNEAKKLIKEKLKRK